MQEAMQNNWANLTTEEKDSNGKKTSLLYQGKRL